MQKNADFFDIRAADWEQNYYPPSTRKRLEALIPRFNVAPGTRILDIGTGPGILIPYLRNIAGRQGRICALHISYQMARQALKKLGIGEDIVLQADVHRIPFKNNIFDRVICFAAFPYFDRPDQAIREMARVGKSGASVVIAHLMSQEVIGPASRLSLGSCQGRFS
jgi:ubiquinone/menaquinone biosynthesis C-methylase UbiE